MPDIQRCPFLASLSATAGSAVNRLVPAAAALSRRVCGPLSFDDDNAAILHCYESFHGCAGPVPLGHRPIGPSAPVPSLAAIQESARTDLYNSDAKKQSTRHCPVKELLKHRKPLGCNARGACDSQNPRNPFKGAPMASLSLSFQHGLTSWWNDRQRERQQQEQRNRNSKSRRPRGKSGRGNARKAQGHSAPTASSSISNGASGSSSAGECPLRNLGGLGKPIGGLIALAAERQMKCPEAIIQARAMVARLKPVQQLRPQALPLKLLAIGTFTGAANVPSGVARAHTIKFSPEWFLAVHATIPFIAMLRKAVLMPKWAIAFTIAAAILGQVLGARFERSRIAAHSPLLLTRDRQGQTRHHDKPLQSAAAVQTSGFGACSPAAAARPKYGAWRDTYMVPRVC